MTVSHFRFAKTETRDLAERARTELRLGEPPEGIEWLASPGAFFTAFAVIAALLALVALVLSVAR